MWLLENIKDPGAVGSRFYLIEGQNYTVGRKDCKILIPNDSSVSRKHATLTVTHSDANLSKPEAKPILTLTDSSKFGTLRNGSKITGGSVSLEDGDDVVFGAMNSNQWRVTYKPFVVAFSSLPSADKKSLKLLTRRLGGHVLSEWSKECTHLVMTHLTVTIKVISALVTCRPIVTPAFLRKMEEAALSNSPLPDPLNFQPAIAEASIKEDEVSFQPNVDRQTLFRGKTLVFLAQKQFKQLGQTVQLAGGKPLLINEGLTKREEKLLIDAKTIVMYADPQDQSQIMTQAAQEWVTEVMNILKRNGLRPVPQSELGLAVLYASTDVHCNPKIAQAGLTLLHPVVAPSLPTQDILASQTQSSELTRSHSAMKHKPVSVRGRPEDPNQRKLESRTERADQTPKKRMRDDEDTSKFASLSKVARKDSSKPTTVITVPTPETPSRTAAGSIPETSPELPFVGKAVSRLAERSHVRFVDRAKMKSSATGVLDTDDDALKEQGPSSKVFPTKRKEDPARDTSPHKRSRTFLSKTRSKKIKTEDSSCQGSSSDDIISPSERIGENRSRSRKENDEQVPYKLKQEVIEIDEDEEQPESVAAGTLPDDDVIPPSGRDGGRGRRRVEDLFAMDVNDVGEEMWKKKAKRSRLVEEVDQLNDGTDTEQEQRASSRCPLQDVPKGYITANQAIKSEPTSPQDPTLPYNVAVVEQVTLTVRRPLLNGTHHTSGGKRGPTNFKKFKKASYAGQFSMPRIIGGSDLQHHRGGFIKEAEEMMEQERETIRKRHKEKDLADQLFDWDPRPIKRRR